MGWAGTACWAHGPRFCSLPQPHMAWAPDQALSPTLRWPLVASATDFGSECLVGVGGWYLGFPLSAYPASANPLWPWAGVGSAWLCPWFPWAQPHLAPVASAVAGDRIRPLCLKCILQRPRHCPILPWQKRLTAMQCNGAHLSSTLSVPVIELGINMPSQLILITTLKSRHYYPHLQMSASC